jgi:Ser/Thr protein kinase RdoA (MazF antagonist)
MGARDLTIDDLLNRIELHLTLDDACLKIINDYMPTATIKVQPLFVGHSELNAKIKTDRGVYVIKFFNKAKNRVICQLVADALLVLNQHNIPVPTILKGPMGYLYELPPNVGRGFLIITSLFEGKTFNELAPALSDKVKTATYLAHIHQLADSSLQVESLYDPWLLEHLSKEFDKTGHLLVQRDRALIAPFVDEFRKLDLALLPRSTVHNDLHRDNIQKAPTGELCLFDMETIGIGYPVMDLATYIGLTCLEAHQTATENQQIYTAVIDAYQRVRPLTSYELSNLELLTKCIFASNIVAANYLIRSKGDDTQETYKWYALGRRLLKKFSGVSLRAK